MKGWSCNAKRMPTFLRVSKYCRCGFDIFQDAKIFWKIGVRGLVASCSTSITISCFHQATTVIARMDDRLKEGMAAQQWAADTASVVELRALEQGCYKSSQDGNESPSRFFGPINPYAHAPSADGCDINHGLSFERGLASVFAPKKTKTRIIIIIIIILVFLPASIDRIGWLPSGLRSISLARNNTGKSPPKYLKRK